MILNKDISKSHYHQAQKFLIETTKISVVIFYLIQLSIDMYAIYWEINSINNELNGFTT